MKKDLLNFKLRNCYEKTDMVYLKYLELFQVCYMNDFDSPEVSSCLNELKILCENENNEYNKLILTDTTSYAFFQFSDFKNGDFLDKRFHSKICALRARLHGDKINISEFMLNDKIGNMEFSVFEVIFAIINIETLKIIKQKIDDLSIDNPRDMEFVDNLVREFNLFFTMEIFSNELLEFLGLFYDMNLDNIPLLDMKLLINKLTKLHGITTANRIMEISVLENVKAHIQWLIMNRDLKNNPSNVCKNLVLINKLEVMFSYLSIDGLREISTYFNKLGDINSLSINSVREMVRRRIIESERSSDFGI